jgi:hypothetical protein
MPKPGTSSSKTIPIGLAGVELQVAYGSRRSRIKFPPEVGTDREAWEADTLAVRCQQKTAETT